MTATFVEQAVKERLVSSGEVYAIVGGRVYAPVLSDRIVYPAVAFRTVQVEDFNSFDGSGDRSDRSTVRFFSTDDSYEGAKRLAKALKIRIHGFKGTIGSVVIHGIHRVREVDFYDSETQTHQVISDYEVMASYA